MEEEQIEIAKNELVADGYSNDVAEALANRGVTLQTAPLLSKREVLEHYLEWNGIIGYADSILSALDNCEANCNF